MFSAVEASGGESVITGRTPVEGAFGQGPELIVMPALRAKSGADGRLVLTEKFVDGMRAFARQWPGRTTAMLDVTGEEMMELDAVSPGDGELPFVVERIPDRSAQLRERLDRADAVLGTISRGGGGEAALAEALPVRTPIVYCLEHTFEVFRAINRHSRNVLRRYRNLLRWGLREPLVRRVVAAAPGIQCNGVPCYETYGPLNRRPLLYFDSRVNRDMMITKEALSARLETLQSGRPLELVFSGRLLSIKGVDHLPLVAEGLRQKGIDFRLQIAGDGPLRARLRRDIRRSGLEKAVSLLGVLDFKSQLLPLVRSQCDLFVCCHRQGDPSCTYLETFACGVPIVGYGNPALAGLERHTSGALTVAGARPHLLAAMIASLDADRGRLADASWSARRFAAANTFEKAFAHRISHLAECSGIPMLASSDGTFVGGGGALHVQSVDAAGPTASSRR